MARTAIATLCLGEKYQSAWERYCKPNWQNYAQRSGYELIAFTEPLDKSERASTRSPSWQKCLVLEALSGYDRVVWLDADIVINREAPAITDGVPAGMVGAVISGSYLHPDLKAIFLRRMRKKSPPPGSDAEAWAADQAGFYNQVGVSCDSSDVVQGGVLVLEQTHRQMLREVYDAFPAELRNFEQLPLSAAILNAGRLHRLNSRFNTVFMERAVVHYPYLFDKKLRDAHDLYQLAVQTELANSYFLHFAGAQRLISYTSV